MALFVKIPVADPLDFTICPGRDDCASAHFFNEDNGFIGIIAAICEDILSLLPSQKGLDLCIVMNLTTRENKIEWIAKGIHQNVYFGGKATAAAA